ncbi:MAG: DUF1501 domain-containing protein [Verrucomicrobia bacterium]|nr:DUF1501 domain-containing protein [Verrucomicrobiota bacterium]
MNHADHPASTICRRAFLARAGAGGAALTWFLGSRRFRDSIAAAEAPGTSQSRGAVNPIHHAPRAKRVIYLYMAGGPSHLETFDPKPELAKLDGQPMPESFTKGQPIAQLQGAQLKCWRPQFGFKKHGRAGNEISDIFPRLATVADDLAIVRSMHTDAINHDPAHTLMNTGTLISGRPSMGSWVTYGLGSETESLPGFVVLTSTEGRSPQPISTRMWHSGFLPGQFSGIELRAQGDPVYYVRNPGGVSPSRQRDVVSTVQSLNRLQDSVVEDPEIAARISQYEMAFRMQASVPDLMDISKEPRSTLDHYGATPGDGSFASNCLLARRLAERGVRFIQLYHRDWDHHNDLVKFITGNAASVDHPTTALITDLKQRGLFKDTLIVWGGEFGRTPMVQANKGGPGRDHHQRAFSMFLCGGGIKAGVTHGATDELGYNAVEDRVHVNDLHATMLHLLGIDHTRLTVKFQGLDMRLTNVGGDVVRNLLA